MATKKIIGGIIVLLFLSAAPVLAVDRVVQADGLGEYETIDDAVGAANDGDVIILMPGVYTGGGNYNVAVEASITIGAQFDPSLVVIDCQGSAGNPRRAFDVVDGNPTFRNLTIKNGYAVDGGAIRVETYTTTINFCRFIDNEAERGGAISAVGADGLDVYGCIFVRNRATTEGGGIYAFGAFPVSVEKTTFFRNSSRDGSGLFMGGDASLDLYRTLIVFGRGNKGVGNYYGGPQTAVQTGIWGNSGGDWVDALAPLRGTAGNIEADPLFCDPDADEPNFNVTANSPAWLQPTLIVIGAGARNSSWEVPIYGVKEDGSGMFPTIQAALDTVPEPGEVVLAAGRYYGVGNISLTFHGKNITLRSRNLDAASTVISGSGENDRIIWLRDGETTAATISHLEIVAGDANQASDHTGYGGGILLTGAGATIRSCNIKFNEAEYGAGISVNNPDDRLVIEDCWLGISNGNGTDVYFKGRRLDLTGSTFWYYPNQPGTPIWIGGFAGEVNIQSCDFENFERAVHIDNAVSGYRMEFRDNTYSNGQNAFTVEGTGEVELYSETFTSIHGDGAISAQNSVMYLYSCTFDACERYGGGGGAINLHDSSLFLNDSEITNCASDQNGGAVLALDSYATMRRNTFANNFCLDTNFDPSGGAIFQSGGRLSFYDSFFNGNQGNLGAAVFCENADILSSHTEFRGNQGALGGVLYVSHGGATADITGSLFADNTVASESAVYVRAAVTTIEQSTFVGNEGLAGRAQIEVDGVGDLIFAGNIVAFGLNVSGLHPTTIQGTWDLTCNDIFGNDAGDYLGSLAAWQGVSGNLWLDPYFCDATGGDYTLQEHSICLGDNNPCGIDIGGLGLGCPDASAALDSALPQALTLVGNTPNPFNPRTEIRFSLPSTSTVELEIHDVAGRRIRTLLNGKELAAGTHDVIWNGTDQAGRGVPSGTYLYRVTAAGEALSGKMVLLR